MMQGTVVPSIMCPWHVPLPDVAATPLGICSHRIDAPRVNVLHMSAMGARMAHKHVTQLGLQCGELRHKLNQACMWHGHGLH